MSNLKDRETEGFGQTLKWYHAMDGDLCKGQEGSLTENIMEGKLRNMTALYLFRQGKVLLLYRQGGRVVNHVWTGSAGGHFEKDELNDAKACVLRELREELKLTPDDVENLALRYVTLRKTQGEIRQNYYFFADLKEGVDEDLTSNEGICRWFSPEEARSLEMPFTARRVVEHFWTQGQHTDKTYVGVADEGKVAFMELSEF